MHAGNPVRWKGVQIGAVDLPRPGTGGSGTSDHSVDMGANVTRTDGANVVRSDVEMIGHFNQVVIEVGRITSFVINTGWLFKHGVHVPVSLAAGAGSEHGRLNEAAEAAEKLSTKAFSVESIAEPRVLTPCSMEE